VAPSIAKGYEEICALPVRELLHRFRGSTSSATCQGPDVPESPRLTAFFLSPIVLHLANSMEISLPIGKSDTRAMTAPPSAKPLSELNRQSAHATPLSKASRTRITRALIIDAAREAFATVGFEGASLRIIAKQARVPHQLATYHFKTKEELWMAVMNQLAFGFFRRFGRRVRGLDGVDAATKLRLLVREFVKYSAENPQLHRLMTMEGRAESNRLRWLVDRHISRHFAISTRLIQEGQALGIVRPGDPGQLHYAVIGIATAAFSVAPEFRLVTGKDPFAPQRVEEVADLVCDFLLASG
jgi:TetR/AcrR family transcriptional regulator